MKEKLSCQVITDMLPIYEEGLCSEESRKLISEHLEECESCRKLCSDFSISAEPNKPVPDEAAAFKKINKKIRLGKIKSRILGISLALIIAALMTLTAGQIMKSSGLPSFDTVISSIEIHSISRKLARGNIDDYMKNISYDNLHFETGNRYISDLIRESETENLKKMYDESFGNKKLRNIRVKTGYGTMYWTDIPAVTAIVKITYTDNDTIELNFIKGSDGLYTVWTHNKSTGRKQDVFNCIDYISWHDMYMRDNFEHLLKKDKLTADDRNSIKDRFAPEYREKAISSVLSYYEKGFSVDGCNFSNIKYDEDKKMVYVDTIITGSDNKGKAVMETRLYLDWTGRLVPDSETSVISDECSDELKDALKHLFG